MRHRKSRLRLPGPADHAQADLRNLAISLITHGRIQTTVKRAKVLRPFVEKIITISRRCASAPDYATRDRHYRLVVERLHSKKAAAISTRVWGAYFLHRPGGYTRILRTGFRVGDNAEMALIEFVIESEHSQIETTHAHLLQTVETYVPKGIGLLETWRSLAPPRIDLAFSDQRNASVSFVVRAELLGEVREASDWPKHRGKNIPMELTVSVLAPKAGSEMRLETTRPVGLPSRPGRITFHLSPNADRSEIKGFVSLAGVPAQRRYCSVAVDGPTGEVFHATLLDEETTTT